MKFTLFLTVALTALLTQSVRSQEISADAAIAAINKKSKDFVTYHLECQLYRITKKKEDPQYLSNDNDIDRYINNLSKKDIDDNFKDLRRLAETQRWISSIWGMRFNVLHEPGRTRIERTDTSRRTTGIHRLWQEQDNLHYDYSNDIGQLSVRKSVSYEKLTIEKFIKSIAPDVCKNIRIINNKDGLIHLTNEDIDIVCSRDYCIHSIQFKRNGIRTYKFVCIYTTKDGKTRPSTAFEVHYFNSGEIHRVSCYKVLNFTINTEIDEKRFSLPMSQNGMIVDFTGDPKKPVKLVLPLKVDNAIEYYKSKIRSQQTASATASSYNYLFYLAAGFVIVVLIVVIMKYHGTRSICQVNLRSA